MNPSLILCPLSLSPSGRSALAQALAIARWYESEVHVLFVRGRRQTSLKPVPTPLAEARLEPRVSQFVESVNPSETRLSVVELSGDPVGAVSDYAKRTATDLIVVAKHGRPYGAYWRPGAYATDLARVVSCPILAVPQTQKPTVNVPFIEILCPRDFSSASAAAMNQALVLAQQSAGRITLLHVLDGFPDETVYSGARAMQLIDDYNLHVEKTKSELRRLVPPDAYNWCDVEAIVESGVPHRSILATATGMGADLIVMGFPRRSAINRVVMGSTTSPVLRRASCPVLVVPAYRGEQRADQKAHRAAEAALSAFVMRPDTTSASAHIGESITVRRPR
jgi:nucleotide-binding universal stress UspA family protein